MKNGSHRYDANRPRPRHGHKHTKYKMCLRIMVVICIKQHLSNSWSSIHEKVMQHWGWNEKSVYLCTKKLSFPLRISSVNVTKSLMENLIFCAVTLEIIKIRL